MMNRKYIGRCLTCKHTERRDRPGPKTCTRCSTAFVYQYNRPYALKQPSPIQWKQINGYISASHKCDVRCTHAIGCDCECSCGGANHGSAWDIKINTSEKVAA